MQAYTAVQNKSSSWIQTKKLALRHVVKKLARLYPEMQATTVVKRSRQKLRTVFPKDEQKVKKSFMYKKILIGTLFC